MDIRDFSVPLAPPKMPAKLNALRVDQNSHGPINIPTLDTQTPYRNVRNIYKNVNGKQTGFLIDVAFIFLWCDS